MKIAVLGAGAWGTALAVSFSDKHKVSLWGRNDTQLELLARERSNRRYLPGIAFPEGSPPTAVPVHPTQLYEVAWLLLIGAVLWRRRKTSPFLFAEYFVLSGAGRFAVEILRVNPRIALGMSGAQWIGTGMVLLGGATWLYARRRQRVVA